MSKKPQYQSQSLEELTIAIRKAIGIKPIDKTKYPSEPCETHTYAGRDWSCRPCRSLYSVALNKATLNTNPTAQGANKRVIEAQQKHGKDYKLHMVADQTDARSVVLKIDRVFLKDLYATQKLCYYCCTTLQFDVSRQVHLEHKHPIAKGGDNSSKNLTLCCQRCNNTKNSKTEADYIEKMKQLWNMKGPTLLMSCKN